MQPLLQWKSNKHDAFWLCVCTLSYPACNAHAPYCHLRPARMYNIFPHYLINGMGFRKKLMNMKCMFWFSLQLLYEIFLILRRTQQDMIKNIYTGLNVKYRQFLSDFNETWIFSTDFQKIHQISWKSIQWEPSCSMCTDRWTDGQTDRHDKANSFFVQFCKCT